MKITRHTTSPGVLVVQAGDEINDFGSEALNKIVDGAIDAGGGGEPVRTVVVDCSGLEFLGSAGIGNLLHLQKHLLTRGGKKIGVRLAGLDADQAQVLKVTRVHTMIEVFPDVEAAAEA